MFSGERSEVLEMVVRSNQHFFCSPVSLSMCLVRKDKRLPDKYFQISQGNIFKGFVRTRDAASVSKGSWNIQRYFSGSCFSCYSKSIHPKKGFRDPHCPFLWKNLVLLMLVTESCSFRTSLVPIILIPEWTETKRRWTYYFLIIWGRIWYIFLRFRHLEPQVSLFLTQLANAGVVNERLAGTFARTSTRSLEITSWTMKIWWLNF